MQQEESIEQIIESLTPKELRFCQLYARCLNGAKAAREAGYSENCDDEIAYENLRKPQIKKVVAHYMEMEAMSMEEAVKRISDTASTRLNDYFTVKQVLRTPTVRKPLQQVIDELEQELDFEEEYFLLAENDEDDQKSHSARQKARRNTILRYRLELKRNQKAYRDVDGEPEWTEQADVDLVALAKADAKGAVKSISFGEYGPKVELYSAESALKTILEVHGKIIQRHELTGKDGKDLIPAALDKLSTEDLNQLQKIQRQLKSD